MKKVILLICFGFSLIQAEAQSLIKTALQKESTSLIDEQLSKRIAIIDYEVIDINTDAMLKGKTVLEFFGHRISVYEQKLTVRGLKNYSWFAKSVDGMNTLVLTVLSDDIQGMITVGTEIYRIETIEEQYIVTQINQSKYPDEDCGNFQNANSSHEIIGNDEVPSINNNFQKIILGEDFTCRLRILVLYTPAAASAAPYLQYNSISSR